MKTYTGVARFEMRPSHEKSLYLSAFFTTPPQNKTSILWNCTHGIQSHQDNGQSSFSQDNYTSKVFVPIETRIMQKIGINIRKCYNWAIKSKLLIGSPIQRMLDDTEIAFKPQHCCGSAPFESALINFPLTMHIWAGVNWRVTQVGLWSGGETHYQVWFE